MTEGSGNQGKTIVAAAIAGGLVGAALGLLFAPKSGKELREDISGKAKETWDKMELLEQGQALVQNIRGLVSDIKGIRLKGPGQAGTPAVEEAAPASEEP
ncbi:MAG TPA: YtxH domain-containing protein [Bacillota bacterium]|nr:YtxH domain-containing protein [Bacillota bacterium]